MREANIGFISVGLIALLFVFSFSFLDVPNIFAQATG
ncbi:hypothetical protein BD31_I1512, partial [Candidatus Nitrosopumilus salaria BD31]